MYPDNGRHCVGGRRMVRPPMQQWPSTTQITHSINSSAGVTIMPCNPSTKMWCNWALIMCRFASQLHVSLATYDVATRCTCSPGCTHIYALVKLVCRCRALRIFTIEIKFDPAVNSIWTWSIRIGVDSNSVLKSVRTLHLIKYVSMECEYDLSFDCRTGLMKPILLLGSEWIVPMLHARFSSHSVITRVVYSQ